MKKFYTEKSTLFFAVPIILAVTIGFIINIPDILANNDPWVLILALLPLLGAIVGITAHMIGYNKRVHKYKDLDKNL